MFENKLPIEKETIISGILLVLSITNMILTNAGMNPLPWSETEIYAVGSAVVMFISGAWAWWRNNSVTQAALNGDAVKDELKGKV